MKKRGLSLLLVILLLCSALPLPAVAVTGNRDAWDGSADIAWHQDDDTEFHLETAEQFAGLAKLVNEGTSFSGKTVFLKNDLDLAGHDWISIGDGNNAGRNFNGTFDGQNHTIYHLTSTTTVNYYHGLFGVISSGTVRNVGIVDADVTAADTDSSLRIGILADWANQSKIVNCFVTGVVRGGRHFSRLVGGLVGQCTAGSQVIGCYSSATVDSVFPADTLQEADTVGGLIGQWENATADSLIADCWFDGTIRCADDDAAVGGILGANFDFGTGTGVTICNSVVSTTDITCTEPGNITWIGAIVDGVVENCYWPLDDSLPEPYAAVVKLVVDWTQGTASADPDFDETVCGEGIIDFESEELLQDLNAHAQPDIQWVMGQRHPVFAWDVRNIAADYEKVDAALAKAAALNPEQYQNFAAVEAAVEAVVRGKTTVEQDAVDAMAKAIEEAIAALKKAAQTVSSETTQQTEGTSAETQPVETTEQSEPETPTGEQQTGWPYGFAVLAAMVLVAVMCPRARRRSR